MKLLLDANVLLWAIYEPERLTSTIATLLQDRSNALLVSHASLWELLAKVGSGRLLMAGKSVSHVLQRISELDVVFIPITTELIVAASTLPQHHGDPFDRMLIAQSMEEDAVILSSDRVLPSYGVPVIWR